NVFAGQFVADPVRDARRRDPQPTVALATRFDTRATNAIVILQRLHHRRQILRVVLQIGIERCDVTATRDLHSSPASPRLTAPEPEPLAAQTRIVRAELQ